MKHGGDVYNNKIEHDFSINLNPNDNPDEIMCAIKRGVDMIDRYPDLDYSALRSGIAAYERVSEELIVCGNGASELIHTALRVLAPKRVILLAPGFSGYLHAAGNIEIIYYNLKEENDFRLDDDFISYLESNGFGEGDVLIIADPNNPNGLRIDNKLLAGICTVCHMLGIKIILDRCFYHLTDIYSVNCGDENDISSLNIYEIADYLSDNVIFINAYTKTFSVPGIRIGYAISYNKQIIEDIRKYLPEWNVSVIASEVGIAASGVMAKADFLKESLFIIENERNFMIKELNELGIRVYPSDTNYLLLFSKYSLYDKLLDRGILIRDCSDYVGLRDGYYRIAIRKHEDNIILIDALKSIIKD